jgi:glutathione S-transferase
LRKNNGIIGRFERPAAANFQAGGRHVLTLYRVALSTNVERVALALGHKGLQVDSISVPYDDRTKIRKVSGQDLVPVLVDDGKVVIDSMEIVRYLEGRFPTPRLYPEDAARRADCLVFIDWFNRVWKRPPNEMEAELSKPAAERDTARVERLGRAMQGYLDWFEQMLTGRDYLLGEFSAADVAAFPFVKYATYRDPSDPYLFHKILVDYQKPGTDHPRLVDWIARVDRRPRA